MFSSNRAPATICSCACRSCYQQGGRANFILRPKTLVRSRTQINRPKQLSQNGPLLARGSGVVIKSKGIWRRYSPAALGSIEIIFAEGWQLAKMIWILSINCHNCSFVLYLIINTDKAKPAKRR